MISQRIRQSASRGIALAVLAVGVDVAYASSAQAHVRVLSYQPAVQGSYAALTFRVPTEEDTPTTKLEVTLPADTPLASVSMMPKAGWAITVEKSMPKTPLNSDDGAVTEVVSRITWTATAGGIPPGGYDEFNISVGPLPKVTSMSFPALQTYANGDVVRWIEPAPAGGAQPDHPVPTLTLVAAGATVSPQATVSAGATVIADATGGTSAESNADGTARGLGIAGFVLGALGFVVAGGCALRVRRNS